MAHTHDPDILLEILGDELRTIVGNNMGLYLRELLMDSLQDNLNILLRHLLAQFPVNDVTAAAIQDAAQVIEGAEDIDVADINMPVFMRLQGLLEAVALTALFDVPASKQTGSTEHTVNATGAYGNNILIKHHIGQTTVSLQRILCMEIDNCLLLPLFEPEVAGYQAIMFIYLSLIHI